MVSQGRRKAARLASRARRRTWTMWRYSKKSIESSPSRSISSRSAVTWLTLKMRSCLVSHLSSSAAEKRRRTVGRGVGRTASRPLPRARQSSWTAPTCDVNHAVAVDVGLGKGALCLEDLGQGNGGELLRNLLVGDEVGVGLAGAGRRRSERVSSPNAGDCVAPCGRFFAHGSGGVLPARRASVSFTLFQCACRLYCVSAFLSLGASCSSTGA